MAINQLISYTAKNVGTTAATVFTAQAAVQTTIQSLTLSNTSALPVTASIIITRGGVDVYVVKNATVNPGGTLIAAGWDQKICLIAGDQLKAVSSVANSLDAVASALLTGEVAAGSQPVQDSPPPAIGTAMSGGYLAGRFTLSGSNYRLIIAPKAYESSKQMKTTFTSLGSNLSTIDGYTLTQDYNNAGGSTYPAAYYCRTLNIAGYTDWYIPSRDEMEIIYRNLKPTTASNITTAYNGYTPGTNSNSIPVGTAYTTSVPAQTSLALFQIGGAECLNGTLSYWTSSRAATQPVYAWNITSSNGSPYWGTYPTDSLLVRPVRKELDV